MAKPSAPAEGDPLGGWQLVEATVDGLALDLLEDHPVTAVVEASSTAGTTACNQYVGRIELTSTECPAALGEQARAS